MTGIGLPLEERHGPGPGLGLLLFLFFAFDREHVLGKLVTAVAGSVGTHHVFDNLLRVPLPYSSLPALLSAGI